MDGSTAVVLMKIGFKNGTVLEFNANSFDVLRDPLGRETYRWNTVGLNTNLLTLDPDEILWITKSKDV